MSTPKIKINGQWQPLVTIPTTISSFSNDVGYIISSAVNKIFVQSSAPSTAANNDLWVDTTNSELKVKLNNDWVSLGSSKIEGYVASDTTANFTVSDTAPSNPQAGDVWIDMSSDGIPMANGVDF